MGDLFRPPGPTAVNGTAGHSRALGCGARGAWSVSTSPLTGDVEAAGRRCADPSPNGLNGDKHERIGSAPHTSPKLGGKTLARHAPSLSCP